ncbi:MAG: type II toxin-antitoxin system VapB family antitoxin [Acidimicrobiales bacterium]
MLRRTTIEIESALLDQAQRSLGQTTIRGTVEEALRRAVGADEAETRRRALRQQQFLVEFAQHADIDVLMADDMWR